MLFKAEFIGCLGVLHSDLIQLKVIFIKWAILDESIEYNLQHKVL